MCVCVCNLSGRCAPLKQWPEINQFFWRRAGSWRRWNAARLGCARFDLALAGRRWPVSCLSLAAGEIANFRATLRKSRNQNLGAKFNSGALQRRAPARQIARHRLATRGRPADANGAAKPPAPSESIGLFASRDLPPHQLSLLCLLLNIETAASARPAASLPAAQRGRRPLH